MAELLVDGEILLYGVVGDGLWDDGFSAMDVAAALSKHGRNKDITLRINSGGGFVWDGMSIYNALMSHKGKKTVYVDGIAASAASLIAMAGDEIVMRRGSVMMIHDPAGMTLGTIEDHKKTIESLEAIVAGAVDIYAEKSGRTPADVRKDMASELWLSGQQAIEMGYATSLVDAEAEKPTMFAYSMYQHPPSYVMMANVPKPVLARKKGTTAKPDGEPVMEKLKMSETPPAPAGMSEDEVQRRVDEAVAAALAAQNERTNSILTSDEAKGREDLAKFLAFSTTLSVDAVKAALTKAPKPAEKVVNPFEMAMSRAGNPQIGPDAEFAPGEQPERMSLADKVRRDQNVSRSN